MTRRENKTRRKTEKCVIKKGKPTILSLIYCRNEMRFIMVIFDHFQLPYMRIHKEQHSIYDQPIIQSKIINEFFCIKYNSSIFKHINAPLYTSSIARLL